MSAPATPGPPRLTRADGAVATQLVLDAALKLAYEGGVRHVTVERITQTSGVAKTTIYRRWPNASAVVMEAYLAEIQPMIGYADQGDVVETFRRTVRDVAVVLSGYRGTLLRQLLGEAQHDAELQKAFVDRWTQPRREAARAVLRRAMERGELRPDIDIEVTIDAIYGAIYYRMNIPYAELTADYAERLVTQIFHGLLVRPDNAARAPGG